jgi:hypothetical protein
MDSPWKEPDAHPHQQTPDEMRSSLLQIQRLIHQIADRKEELAREALTHRCPCGATVRTAEWQSFLEHGVGLTERLVEMCDAGHWWAVGEARLRWAGQRGSTTQDLMVQDGVFVPYIPLQVSDATVCPDLLSRQNICTCGEDEAEVRGEVTLPHKSDCPKGEG